MQRSLRLWIGPLPFRRRVGYGEADVLWQDYPSERRRELAKLWLMEEKPCFV